MGKKRTNDGKVKAPKSASTSHKPVAPSKTPPGAQLPMNSSNTTEPSNMETSRTNTERPRSGTIGSLAKPTKPSQQPTTTAQPKPNSRTPNQRRLPGHVKITKRPIHHPAAPSQFSSSDSPKTLYITPTTPFIPCIKRTRKILAEIQKRHQQSLSQTIHKNKRQKRSAPLAATGRLRAADVEREIVEGAQDGEATGQGGVAEEKGAEEVYLKATGRAIERALQIGVHFQGEVDCNVRVEMGSVQAIDDIAIRRKRGGEVEGALKAKEDGVNKDRKDEKWKEEDIPETRVRTLSSITVAISLK
ncbi:hypothetical protein CC80DRAFT_20201 [Byssothecium circinans]|uniref:Uncharacterized protein n=1 Tax=Byssothecium circinans TaxID=147558 RepID=A0A6A5U299_9PLEO|nr:hypothetical protein CC80DRAFT_20201 [Byssothecium circinans]